MKKLILLLLAAASSLTSYAQSLSVDLLGCFPSDNSLADATGTVSNVGVACRPNVTV